MEEKINQRLFSFIERENNESVLFFTSTLKEPMWNPVTPSSTVSTSPPVDEQMGICQKNCSFDGHSFSFALCLLLNYVVFSNALQESR
jgi:hypothetical protein